MNQSTERAPVKAESCGKGMASAEHIAPIWAKTIFDRTTAI